MAGTEVGEANSKMTIAEQQPFMRVRGLTKKFGGTIVLRDVDLDIWAGEVVGIAGHNGAGKSTLIKVLTGAIQPDKGEILLDGHSVKIRNRAQSEHLGFGVVDQQERLLPNLSVVENVWLGHPYPRKVYRAIDWSAMEQQILARAMELGISFPLRARGGDLLPMDQRLVEITRALLRKRRLVIFDEATSALEAQEVERFHAVLRLLKDQGVAIVLISHQLDELLKISDRLVVMREGSVVADDRVTAYDKPRLFDLVAGISWDQAMAGLQPGGRDHPSEGDVHLEIDGLTGSVLREVSFQVRQGEILGLAGLEGSGKEEVLAVLSGLERACGGTLRMDGHERPFARDVREAKRMGLALLPRDRKVAGLFGRQGLCFNMTASHLWKHRLKSWLPLVNHGSQQFYTKNTVNRLQIYGAGSDQPVDNLSGGNQQKVMFGRVIGLGPRVLLLDEPTEGIDVSARAEVFRVVRELAEQGTSVVYSANDAEELSLICTRVLVFHGGRVVAELRGGEINDARILRLTYEEQGPREYSA